MLLIAAWCLTGCSGDDKPDSVAVTRPDGGQPSDAGRPDAGPVFVRPDDPQYPQTEGTVELPADGGVVSYRFMVEAQLGALDVHLSIDTTSSIGDEINQLQTQLDKVVIAGITERVADVAFGVSRFEDFPAAPFGSDGNDSIFPTSRPDSPFLLLTPITTSRARLNDAIQSLDRPLGFGGDTPEAGAEALYQIATGEGYDDDDDEIVKPFNAARTRAAGEIGGVGFREQSLHVVLHVTDARMHAPGDYGLAFPDTHSLADATQALRAIDARVISVVTCPEEQCEGQARRELSALAIDTNADVAPEDGQCSTGILGAEREPVFDTCPLVFDVSSNGEGLSETLVDGIVDLVDNLNFEEIQATVGADPLGFITAVRAVPAPDADDPPVLADKFPDGEPDGVDDTFVGATPRTPIEFEVLLSNRGIAPSAVQQRFRVLVRVTGDGLLLQEHGIAIVVPPGQPSVPDDSDAGFP